MEKRQNFMVTAGIVEGTGHKEHFVSVAFSGTLADGPIDGARYNLAHEYARSHGYAPYDYERIARVMPDVFRRDKSGAFRRTASGSLIPITTDFVGYYKRFVLPRMVDAIHADYTRRVGGMARYHAAIRVTPGLLTDGAIRTKKPRTTKRRGGKKNHK